MKHPIPSHCRFHPERSTHWYCGPCRLPLCTVCKPYAEQLPHAVSCPLCGGAMDERRVESGSSRPDRAALKNAVGLPGLVMAAAVAVIATLGFESIPGLLLTLPVGALLLLLMIMLVRRAGEGRSQPPAPGELIDIDQLECGLRLLPLGLPFAALLLLAAVTTPTLLTTLAWLVVAAALPAVLMTAVVTESPREALTPTQIARVVDITRRQYAAAAALSAAVVLAFAATISLSSAAEPLARGALSFMASLFSLGLASWLGSVVRLHRRMLDYPAGVAPIDRPRRPEPSVHEPALLAADAETLLRVGRTHDTRQLLGQALTRYPDDPRLNELFDKLVSETARPGEIRNHLERRMQRLIRGGQFAAATELWQRHSPRLDNWMPRLSETRYRLALELDEMGEHQTAFRLLISLPPDDEKFTHIAEAWMEAARILEDHLDDPKRSSELRRTVINRYPARARRWQARWQRNVHSGKDETDLATPVHG